MVILNLLVNLLVMFCLSVVVLGLGVAILTRGIFRPQRRLSGQQGLGYIDNPTRNRQRGGEEL